MIFAAALDAWAALNTTALRRYFETFDPATYVALPCQSSARNPQTYQVVPCKGGKSIKRLQKDTTTRHETALFQRRLFLARRLVYMDEDTTRPGHGYKVKLEPYLGKWTILDDPHDQFAPTPDAILP